jgi:hypothetical protein
MAAAAAEDRNIRTNGTGVGYPQVAATSGWPLITAAYVKRPNAATCSHL